jgi:6-pyruvoyl-tetrahydropterin synthase
VRPSGWIPAGTGRLRNVTRIRTAGQPVEARAFPATVGRGIIRSMIRLFVDRLTVLDFSYLHPRRGLLGESWLCDLELAGEPDAQGMVLDFAEVKRGVKRLVDERFDHRLIVPRRHPGLALEADAGQCALTFPFGEGRQVVHVGPAVATCLVDAAEITPASLADAIEATLRPELPENVAAVRVTLREEPHDAAFYQYSHGLPRHAGNCQRIAHGHRSRIEITRDGLRDTALEREWAGRWRDVYIGTRANLVGTRLLEGTTYCQFGYHGTQGEFALELPADRCYLIGTESTVENLARHVAEQTAAEHPGARYRVRAFEGVDKGAIAEA